MTGSIGVIVEYQNFSELSNKIGISVDSIKSGKIKGGQNPLSPFDPLVKNNDQKLVDYSFDWFISLIKNNRNIDPNVIDLISDGTLSGRLAKDVFEIMLETKKNPKLIVEEKDLSQITDESSIEKIVDKIIESNIEKVAEAREKPKLIGWFVGQVMKESQGKANPATVNDLVKKKIGT